MNETLVDCRCETILSPQMEYVPGVHHDPDCPMRREPEEVPDDRA